MFDDNSANAPTPPSKPILNPGWPRDAAEVKERLRQLWHGTIPLAQTFWIYYFGIVFILELLGKSRGPLGDIFNIVALAWAAFMVKPIIAAADQYQGDKIWAILAKAAALIIALAVLSGLLDFTTHH